MRLPAGRQDWRCDKEKGQPPPRRPALSSHFPCIKYDHSTKKAFVKWKTTTGWDPFDSLRSLRAGRKGREERKGKRD